MAHEDDRNQRWCQTKIPKVATPMFFFQSSSRLVGVTDRDKTSGAPAWNDLLYYLLLLLLFPACREPSLVVLSGVGGLGNHVSRASDDSLKLFFFFFLLKLLARETTLLKLTPAPKPPTLADGRPYGLPRRARSSVPTRAMPCEARNNK